MLKIIEVKSDTEILEVRRLFAEYIATLKSRPDNHNSDIEMANIPGEYASPSGRLLLASFEGIPGNIGFGALRKIDDRICEMSQLYVSPMYRGMGIGRVLCERLIDMAIEAGYYRIRLSVMKNMPESVTLFRTLGFQEIDGYYNNTLKEKMYMELVLA